MSLLFLAVLSLLDESLMLEILALEIDMAPTKTEYGMTLDPTQARAICSLQPSSLSIGNNASLGKGREEGGYKYAMRWRGLVCAESKLAGSKEAEKRKRGHPMMKRLVVLRRCQPILQFRCCSVRYSECRRNHAASMGGYAVDGCRQFIADGEEGSAALKCVACGCHRSFHRRVQVYEVAWDYESDKSSSSSSSSGGD
ncbi:hypothetical protein BRADI_4g30230v3 [Brachypodium distachyon]|uniref:ZF-HD dimerization-type domain-containing protein n=1 Tax=Brachypodium distachyon TaxID=15368 RepID=A0A2K2CRA9_BRADI|nr:hypothetical protein BRADI_4g30230v3 [Brachypodium distachyon]